MLQVNDLSVSFSSYSIGLWRREVCAMRSLDLRVEAGEVMALVGQSGAGKSLLAHALLGILPANARIHGSMRFKGRELTPDEAARMRGREIALVPQSVTYLNPLLRVGAQIARAAALSGIPKGRSHDAALDCLRRYRLGDEVAARLPFQLSGGMARRVLTASATVGMADLLLADEPTNGLDRDVAHETLDHLRELADTGKGVLLITHDVASALRVADRVTVFCGGVTVEEARADAFNGGGGLLHPYSRALRDAMPGNSFVDNLPPEARASTNGGCPFSARCSLGCESCSEHLPELRQTPDGLVRCSHA
jgi:peptide/nickel transport system ATP-binding protein